MPEITLSADGFAVLLDGRPLRSFRPDSPDRGAIAAAKGHADNFRREAVRLFESPIRNVGFTAEGDVSIFNNRGDRLDFNPRVDANRDSSVNMSIEEGFQRGRQLANDFGQKYGGRVEGAGQAGIDYSAPGVTPRNVDVGATPPRTQSGGSPTIGGVPVTGDPRSFGTGVSESAIAQELQRFPSLTREAAIGNLAQRLTQNQGAATPAGLPMRDIIGEAGTGRTVPTLSLTEAGVPQADVRAVNRGEPATSPLATAVEEFARRTVPTGTSPIAQAVAGAGQAPAGPTLPPAAPPAPTPTPTPRASLADEYQRLSKERLDKYRTTIGTFDEEITKTRTLLTDLKNSLNLGLQDSSERLAPMSFITGEQQAIERRAQLKGQPFLDTLSRLSASRGQAQEQLTREQQDIQNLLGFRGQDITNEEQAAAAARAASQRTEDVAFREREFGLKTKESETERAQRERELGLKESKAALGEIQQVGNDLVRIKPDGTSEMLWRAPEKLAALNPHYEEDARGNVTVTYLDPKTGKPIVQKVATADGKPIGKGFKGTGEGTVTTSDRASTAAKIAKIRGSDGFLDTAEYQRIREDVATQSPKLLDWFDITYPVDRVLNPSDPTARRLIQTTAGGARILKEGEGDLY